MRPDSGFSSLPSFDGKTCFNQYQKRFEDRLVDVMVNILAKVEPISDVPHRDSERSKTVKSTPSLPDISPFPAPIGFQSPEEICVYSAVPASSSPVDDVFSSLPPTRLQSTAVSATPSSNSASFSNISDILTDFLDFFPDAPPPSPCSSVFTLPGSQSSISSDVLSSTSTPSPQLHHDNKQQQPSPSPVFSHLVDPTSKKSRECKICHKILASASNLRIHMRIHTGNVLTFAYSASETSGTVQPSDAMRGSTPANHSGARLAARPSLPGAI
ncbi:sal-like protein 1 [Haliotis rubra]|uniref:sal-like protein 1 n=1 Tax=Haliotis rubra TaxID=36100 RepID=UPI001EE5E32E|nr:sal-like protein 1 [Haliotis rubra]